MNSNFDALLQEIDDWAAENSSPRLPSVHKPSIVNEKSTLGQISQPPAFPNERPSSSSKISAIIESLNSETTSSVAARPSSRSQDFHESVEDVKEVDWAKLATVESNNTVTLHVINEEEDVLDSKSNTHFTKFEEALNVSQTIPKKYVVVIKVPKGRFDDARGVRKFKRGNIHIEGENIFTCDRGSTIQFEALSIEANNVTFSNVEVNSQKTMIESNGNRFSNVRLRGDVILLNEVGLNEFSGCRFIRGKLSVGISVNFIEVRHLFRFCTFIREAVEVTQCHAIFDSCDFRASEYTHSSESKVKCHNCHFIDGCVDIQNTSNDDSVSSFFRDSSFSETTTVNIKKGHNMFRSCEFKGFNVHSGQYQETIAENCIFAQNARHVPSDFVPVTARSLDDRRRKGLKRSNTSLLP